MNVLVIGAGLFGCCSAIELSRAGFQVDLIDSENDIMLQASRVNHNRIHLGYHYLRSIETAEQSIDGLLSFLFNFGHAVENQFPNYYAIAKEGSKTTPEEFLNFCTKVGISYDYESPEGNLFDKDKLSACFKVPEPVFDYITLKQLIGESIAKSKVNLLLSNKLNKLKQVSKGSYEATYNSIIKKYDAVINSSYAGFNNVNGMLGVPLKNLLYERVFIPEFKFDSSPFGLTIMDGPFCSVMPKGKQANEFLLYHVKHSVLENKLTQLMPEFIGNSERTVEDIYENSSLFMPFLKGVNRMTFNEITRVVHKNDDDARLTELYTYEGFDNYFSLLSGKITTCVQASLEIKHTLQGRKSEKRFKI
jgi:hypothetical protein